jgi:signal transduction histidine kinase
MTLQSRLVASITGLAVVVTLLPGSWMVWKATGALKSQAQQGQLALARNLAAQVDQSFSQAIQAMEVLAKRRDVVKMERASLLQALSLVSSTSQLFDALVAVLPDGSIQAWNIGRPDQQILPAAGSILDDYRQARTARETVLSEVYKTPSGLAVSLNVPVFRKRRMVGMLLGVLLLSDLGIGNLDEVRVGQSGYAYMVNERGQAVVHPQASKLLEEAPSAPSLTPLLAQDEGLMEYKGPGGQGVLAAYAKVESVSWGVVVRQRAEECYAPADRMFRVLLFSLAVVVLGSAFLALMLGRRLVRPLLALAEEVRRFESGSLDPRPLKVLEAEDEVGGVARALSRMARALKAQQQARERAHVQVLAAEKKLAESERLALIGQLAAGLAHELNNPLAVILGSAREAAVSPGPQAAPWLQRVEREAQRCQRLVKDLLYFSKPLVLERSRADLVDLARQAFQRALQGRGAGYELAAPDRAAWAEVDADRLGQVFVNLFSNAMDSMPQGGRLEFSLKPQASSLRLSLRDQGPGLPPGDLEKIFRPFFTTKPGGTGLGLAICRSILRAHGGSIRAERPRGKGSLFVVELPSDRRKAKKPSRTQGA